MELGLESSSSSTCPLGLSLTNQQNSEISSAESSSPSFDHHQSSDSINDRLVSLSIDAVNGGEDGDPKVEREKNEEENGEIEIVRSNDLKGRNSSDDVIAVIEAADNGDRTEEIGNNEEECREEKREIEDVIMSELRGRSSSITFATDNNGGEDVDRSEAKENRKLGSEEKQGIENVSKIEGSEEVLGCRIGSDRIQTEIESSNNGGEDGDHTVMIENHEVGSGEEKGEVENVSRIEGSDKELACRISSDGIQTEIEVGNNGDEDGDGTVVMVNHEVESGEEKGEIENVSRNEGSDKVLSRRNSNKFPVRPEAEDCTFYVRTGTCKFGMNCKFNHPPNNRRFQGVKVRAKEECVAATIQKVKEKDESVDKEQIDCKYFDRPGGCKFGKACKFNHSRKTNPTSKLNFMGLPIRLGEKECPFYMRNGSCKFGANCRFNHPDPTSAGGPDASPKYSNGGSIFAPNGSHSTLAPWSPPTTLNENPPYIPLMFSPTQGVPSQSEWNAYQAPVYPPERSIHIPPTFAMNSQLLKRPEEMLGDEFPERPGQPECSYFLRNGDCKYRSACKFHHPKNVMAQSPSCLLSDLGLPLRPGENVCSYYSRYGICKYGPACKYDHPINYAHSSELTVSAVDQTSVLGDSVVNNQAMAAES
ncbi:zinc finger CCCH domain-containing protein 43-like [Chenopodium quinoa]|uniref:zinc finger CCCH domain-containing protein 43-like n=1 Tax=Chenopodium quinoa TaxID=63459 RepID=UPI000B76E7E1|nr:zinc finger CCCH domain-containing protein 43-like [Chenopodium quinoa]XP_021762042.1 zinc finger CCCH domain-containing protein 43-like [Chenopodium quinoa]